MTFSPIKLVAAHAGDKIDGTDQAMSRGSQSPITIIISVMEVR